MAISLMFVLLTGKVPRFMTQLLAIVGEAIPSHKSLNNVIGKYQHRCYEICCLPFSYNQTHHFDDFALNIFQS